MAEGGTRHTIELLMLLERTSIILSRLREKNVELSQNVPEWLEKRETPSTNVYAKQEAGHKAREYLNQIGSDLSSINTLCSKISGGLRDQRYRLPREAVKPNLLAAATAQGRAFGDLFFAIGAIRERYSAYFPLHSVLPDKDNDNDDDAAATTATSTAPSFEDKLADTVKRLENRLSFYSGITISIEQEPPEPIPLPTAVVPKKDRAFNAALWNFHTAGSSETGQASTADVKHSRKYKRQRKLRCLWIKLYRTSLQEEYPLCIFTLFFSNDSSDLNMERIHAFSGDELEQSRNPCESTNCHVFKRLSENAMRALRMFQSQLMDPEERILNMLLWLNSHSNLFVQKPMSSMLLTVECGSGQYLPPLYRSLNPYRNEVGYRDHARTVSHSPDG